MNRIARRFEESRAAAQSGSGKSKDKVKRNEKTQEASGALKTLQNQYPDLQLSSERLGSPGKTRQYAEEKTGKYNVSIDPKALERMETDPAFRQKVTGHLSRVRSLHDMAENRAKASGITLSACGTVIDEDGNVSTWAVTESGGEKSFAMGETLVDVLDELIGGPDDEDKDTVELSAQELKEKKEEEEDRKAKEEAEGDNPLNVSLDVDITKKPEDKPETKSIDVEA